MNIFDVKGETTIKRITMMTLFEHRTDLSFKAQFYTFLQSHIAERHDLTNNDKSRQRIELACLFGDLDIVRNIQYSSDTILSTYIKFAILGKKLAVVQYLFETFDMKVSLDLISCAVYYDAPYIFAYLYEKTTEKTCDFLVCMPHHSVSADIPLYLGVVYYGNKSMLSCMMEKEATRLDTSKLHNMIHSAILSLLETKVSLYMLLNLLDIAKEKQFTCQTNYQGKHLLYIIMTQNRMHLLYTIFNQYREQLMFDNTDYPLLTGASIDNIKQLMAMDKKNELIQSWFHMDSTEQMMNKFVNKFVEFTFDSNIMFRMFVFFNQKMGNLFFDIPSFIKVYKEKRKHLFPTNPQQQQIVENNHVEEKEKRAELFNFFVRIYDEKCKQKDICHNILAQLTFIIHKIELLKNKPPRSFFSNTHVPIYDIFQAVYNSHLKDNKELSELTILNFFSAFVKRCENRSMKLELNNGVNLIIYVILFAQCQCPKLRTIHFHSIFHYDKTIGFTKDNVAFILSSDPLP